MVAQDAQDELDDHGQEWVGCAQCSIPVTRVSDVLKGGRLYLISVLRRDGMLGMAWML